MSWADLRGAFLERADLFKADQFRADLSAAVLRAAKNLTQEQIELANGDETTKLPDHLQRPEHWNKDHEKT